MDINKFKAEIQAKLDRQKTEWDQMISNRKKADEQAAKNLMSDVEKMTRDQFDTCAQKLFGNLWHK